MTGKDKRGLSAIIATLLIILLTLVSVGIIWVVIRNVVEDSAGQIEISQKCISVQLSAVAVNETVTPGVYDVTLSRGSDSEGDLGVKVNVFQGSSLSSGVIDFGIFGELDSPGTLTRQIDTNTAPATLVAGGDNIEFTVFFVDAEGTNQFCSQSGEFNFS